MIEVRDMCKNFGVTVALNHVSFTVYAGEVVGLIGENGSGKSTVSSIIAGMQPATSGSMVYDGKPWKPDSAICAQEAGIAMIVQETGTIGSITVAENIFLGHEGMFTSGIFISHGKMNREAQALLDRLEIPVDATARTGSLDLATRKLVEIAKALYWKPKVLVVDETTTALSQSGRELLYRYMRQVADEGGAVLFHFTPVGRFIRMVGSNETCAELTGLQRSRALMVAFVMAGIGSGLAALLMIFRNGSVAATMGSSINTDVMLAIVLGGMPIYGGSKSRV